jgi:hypothetical protein
MRAPALFVTLSLAASVALLAGDRPVPGAKDLFYDPAQGNALGIQIPSPALPRPPYAPSPASTPKPEPVAAAKSAPRHPLPTAASSKQTATGKNRGLHYWIELENLGDYVTDQRVFRSGQRIRLHFVSNADGRVLLIQMGASGASTLLFPDPVKGLADNRLKAGEDRILPSDSHWFRFDTNPGIERLLVLFARDTAELERFPVKPAMGPEETQAVVRAANHVAGSKDLVIETEMRTASQIGTYGINLKGDPVVLQIALQHQ